MKPWKQDHQVVHQAGFGLVETMIGMVIALLTTLAIFQTFAVNEAQRRTTGSGSEALQAGTLAMSQIQKIVRNAGYNLTTPTDPTLTPPARMVVEPSGAVIINPTTAATEFLMGCSTQAGMRITPAMVTGTAGALTSDRIVMMEGNSAVAPIPSQLVAPVAAGSTSITITTKYGYLPNDWVVIYEQDPTLNVGTARPVPCTFARVAALPPSPPATPLSPAVITLTTGTVAAYSSFARVVNLGRTPLFQSLTVNGVNQLLLTNLITNATTVLADNVISMRAQIGIDVSNDDVIDEWINPPLLAGDWLNPNSVPTVPSIAAVPVAAGPRALNQIKALRVGVLIRSSQFERPNGVTGLCETTPAGPFSVLEARAGNSAQRIPNMPASTPYTLGGNQRCYRYNTLSSVIPLRNIIMGDI
jgi:type IV pilus assembly protein PilW